MPKDSSIAAEYLMTFTANIMVNGSNRESESVKSLKISECANWEPYISTDVEETLFCLEDKVISLQDS